MECCARPNRSDIHLSSEEEAEIESKTRDYFDGVAPKRHTKPQRSEYASKYVDVLSDDGKQDSIPELDEFQRLENGSQKIVADRNEVSEEFVETDYYKDLNCIGKQHHTTGTGFIRVQNPSVDQAYSLEPDSGTSNSIHASCQCNPATNDWIPDSANTVPFASGKPARSDN